MIYPKASCQKCQKIIHEIETYCMRGPWLSHRLSTGLVHDLRDLGRQVKMPVMIDGKREERVFTPEEFPHYLILPEFHDPPGIVTNRLDHTGRFSFTVWGDEQTRQLNGDGDGNRILAENFDLNKFGRAIAKIAHGYIAGEYGSENFASCLPPYILGEAPRAGDVWIGNWGEDGMKRDPNIAHQIGHAFVEYGAQIRIDVRLRLFASYDRTPVYRIAVGFLTTPIEELPAPRGLHVAHPK